MKSKKVKLIKKGFDYLALSIEAPAAGSFLRINPISNKIEGEDMLFKELKEIFKFSDLDSKPFRDPTNRFQKCSFFMKSGVSLMRFLEKIPITLKGEFFLSRNKPYIIKSFLRKISESKKINVSRLDVYKDFVVPNGIEDLLFRLDHKLIKFDLNKRSKHPVKEIKFTNTITGVLESVTFFKSTFAIKFYRKDLELEQIKSVSKKKRLKQLYNSNKIVRIEISLINSSKRAQAYFRDFLFSKKSLETVCDNIFSEFNSSYPFMRNDRPIKKVKELWTQ